MSTRKSENTTASIQGVENHLELTVFLKVTKIRTPVSVLNDFVNAGPNFIFCSQVKSHSGVIVVTLKQATNQLYPNIEGRTQMLKKQKLLKMFMQITVRSRGDSIGCNKH